MTLPADPVLRRCTRVLALAHELHKRGFQNLAIYSGIAPCGSYWRCELLPVESLAIVGDRVSLVVVPDENRIAHYGSGQDSEYFGWKDAKSDSSRELADKFEQRYESLCRHCHGDNFVYAGWLTRILGIAEDGSLPVMFADYPSPTASPVWGSESGDVLPEPPLQWK